MVDVIFFSLTQKWKMVFTNKNKRFLKALVRGRFFFQNKQPSKGKDLQISKRVTAMCLSIQKEKR